jgi:hypothetical protein
VSTVSLRTGLAAAALVLALPAWGQTAPAAPVPAAAPADPARLAAARQVVLQLFPEGIYKRMMGQSFGPMVDQIMESMGNMPVQEVVRLSGISEEEAAKLGDGTMQQVMAIYDPHWSERVKLGTQAMGASMGDMMAAMEPGMRDGLARVYAREFSAAELAEMGRFFATPAGAHYAGKSMALFMDPEMVAAMGALMPEMMKRMPDMIAAAEAATKHLPAPRANKDLTPAERAQLGALLGIDPSDLPVEGADPEAASDDT